MSPDATWKAKGRLAAVGMGRIYGRLSLRLMGEPALLEIQCAPQMTKTANRLVGSDVRVGGQVCTWSNKTASGSVLHACWIELAEPWQDETPPLPPQEETEEFPGF